jgi:hypothetical protein
VVLFEKASLSARVLEKARDSYEKARAVSKPVANLSTPASSYE